MKQGKLTAVVAVRKGSQRIRNKKIQTQNLKTVQIAKPLLIKIQKTLTKKLKAKKILTKIYIKNKRIIFIK